LATVPPVLLSLVVQLLLPPLKSWKSSVGAVNAISDDENRSKGSPEHTNVDEALAAAIGEAVTVMTTVETAAMQGPAPSGSLVVSVRVTVPLLMLGVYVEVRELELENDPLGALHVALVALPPTAPDRVTEFPEQTFCGEPAFAVAGASTVMTTVEIATLQGPAPSGSLVVSVRVTVPLAILGV
jgi:hypothetical protein